LGQAWLYHLKIRPVWLRHLRIKKKAGLFHCCFKGLILIPRTWLPNIEFD
jgi:hypothetical protein